LDWGSAICSPRVVVPIPGAQVLPYRNAACLVLRSTRLFLLRRTRFVAGTRRVRKGPRGHVGLAGPWPTSTGRFYLEREGCCAVRRNGALPLGSDLLDPRICCRSLLAFIFRPLRHLVLVRYAAWAPAIVTILRSSAALVPIMSLSRRTSGAGRRHSRPRSGGRGPRTRRRRCGRLRACRWGRARGRRYRPAGRTAEGPSRRR